MSPEEKSGKKKPAENFAEMFRPKFYSGLVGPAIIFYSRKANQFHSVVPNNIPVTT